ncbi:GIY-YIG nuclease family protein [Pseudomonas sp. R4-34-07]|uniref:GIY-YIG nuclease family protein n=1 Tax=Pseudomonas sp. R4-34-07 TaxID=658642 RepID=UPI003557A4BC
MVGCYSALSIGEREYLHAWEAKFVDGSGEYGTSDWPGWQKYIGKWVPHSPEINDRFGFVYLVQSAMGYCKIGSSRSVPRRMRQLQCANPEPLILLHQFSSTNARQDEFALHAQFAGKRVRNEWFSLTEADVAVVCALGRLEIL